MRMDRANRPNENALNMRACRYWRPAYSLISWHGKGTSSKEARVVALLSPAQRNNNTTRGTTPGLINPDLGEGSPRVPHPVDRDGQGQGRAQRTVVPPSSSEDDEALSDSSAETSDDDSREVDEEREKFEVLTELSGASEEDSDAVVEGSDAVEEEPGADEENELVLDEELASDSSGDGETDSRENLSEVVGEESHSESSFHSVVRVTARRTMSSGLVGAQGSPPSANTVGHKGTNRAKRNMERQRRQRDASTTHIQRKPPLLTQIDTGQLVHSQKRTKYHLPRMCSKR